MTTLQILVVVLGIITAASLVALALALAFIAKLTGERGDMPCCYHPDIVDREWQGETAPYCNNCGLYQASPLEGERRTETSPGTSGKGALELRPTEGRPDAA